jgi:HEAT repeat protein
MRPKIVILILIAAIGVVALAAVLKGVMGHAPEEVKVPEPPAAEAARPTTASIQAGPGSTNSAAIVEQLRATELDKELDQIRELQAGGADSPTVVPLLLTKVTHREPEVRKAARDALVQLGDTNAIPGLEEALAHVEDPRDKVAMMEAIDYLKLPDAISAQPPSPVAMASDNIAPMTPAAAAARANRMGPKGPRSQPSNRLNAMKARKAGAQPGAPAAPYPEQPQTQPDSPAPDASASPNTTPAPDIAPAPSGVPQQ